MFVALAKAIAGVIGIGATVMTGAALIDFTGRSFSEVAEHFRRIGEESPAGRPRAVGE